MRESCETCRFFVTRGEIRNVGECHRNAPKVIVGDKNQQRAAYWPVVDNIDWCGEFRATEKPKEKA